MNAYAISDIHGCHQTFRAMLQRLHLSRADHLFLLGDFVNKGPDSKGVLDAVFELLRKGYQVNCLRGNHDDLLLEMTHRDMPARHIHETGAVPSLRSFGVEDAQDIPSEYSAFLNRLPTYLFWEKYIFVHAGFSFRHHKPLTDTYAHTRIRTWHHQLDYSWLGDRYVVHGHVQRTMQDILEDLEDFPKSRVLNIDAGCASVWEPGKGHLCAFDLLRHECIFQGYVESSW